MMCLLVWVAQSFIINTFIWLLGNIPMSSGWDFLSLFHTHTKHTHTKHTHVRMHAFIVQHSQLSRALTSWLASNHSANKESTCFVLGISTDTTPSGSHCSHSVQSVTSGHNLVMHPAHVPTCATEMLVEMQAKAGERCCLLNCRDAGVIWVSEFSLSSPRWFTRQLFDESFHNTLKLERWVPELNVLHSALVSNSLLKFLW